MLALKNTSRFRVHGELPQNGDRVSHEFRTIAVLGKRPYQTVAHSRLDQYRTTFCIASEAFENHAAGGLNAHRSLEVRHCPTYLGNEDITVRDCVAEDF